MSLWNDPASDMSGFGSGTMNNEGRGIFAPKDTSFGDKPKNPWARPGDPSNTDGKITAFSANSKKCPSCGANIFYNPRLEGLACNNCGNIFDPQTLEMKWSLGIDNPEEEYGVDEDLDEADQDKQEIVCNACGAQIVANKNTSATVCTFCGSPALVARRLTRRFHPDFVIPFDIDRERAIELFKQHCSRIPHLPRDFTSTRTLKNITGLYVPTWFITCDVKQTIRGRGHQEREFDPASNAAANYRRTDQAEYFPPTETIDGTFTCRFKEVPFDGAKQIANRIIEAAEPFDTSKMVPFTSAYLHGFLAEKYDQMPKDMNDRIMRRLDKYAMQVAKLATFGYKSFEITELDSVPVYSNYVIKYCLIPVWFLHYEYDDRDYQFVINGQTGKVSGEFPYAKGWEAAENIKQKARVESISLNFKVREVLYLLPTVLGGFGYAILRSGRSMRRVTSSVSSLYTMDPIGFILIGLLISALLFFLMKILPGILHKKEKHDVEALGADNSHELASAPDAETYFDAKESIKFVKRESVLPTGR